MIREKNKKTCMAQKKEMSIETNATIVNDVKAVKEDEEYCHAYAAEGTVITQYEDGLIALEGIFMLTTLCSSV